MFIARFSNGDMFRKIIYAVKDFTNSLNIDVKEQGIVMQSMDQIQIALFSLKIQKQAFQVYKFSKEFQIGLKTDSLIKVLKIADPHDSLTLSCEDDEPSHVKIRLQSPKGNKITEFNLSLNMTESETFDIQDKQYSNICTIPFNQYSRICKEIGKLSDVVTIETNKQSIRFSVKAQMGFGGATLASRDTDDDSAVTLSVDEPISQSFSSDHLVLFSKSSTLAPSLKLHLDKENPMMIHLKLFEGKGTFKFFLAPKLTDS